MMFEQKPTELFFVRLCAPDDRVLYIPLQQLVEEYHLVSMKRMIDYANELFFSITSFDDCC